MRTFLSLRWWIAAYVSALFICIVSMFLLHTSVAFGQNNNPGNSTPSDDPNPCSTTSLETCKPQAGSMCSYVQDIGHCQAVQGGAGCTADSTACYENMNGPSHNDSCISAGTGSACGLCTNGYCVQETTGSCTDNGVACSCGNYGGPHDLGTRDYCNPPP
jgi:hypothetical protein